MERLREQIDRMPSYSRVILFLEQIKQHQKDNPSFALDAAKSLLESLSTTILNERNIEIDATLSFHKKIKEAVRTSKMFQSLSDQNTVQNIVSGLATICNSIGTLRNQFGMFSHGRDLKSSQIDILSADLVVESALALSHFILALQEGENRRQYDLSYDDYPEFNQYFDSEHDALDINIAGVQITPSRALFYEDIEAYRMHLNGFNQLKELMINKLNKPCDSDDLEDLVFYESLFSEDEKQVIREKYKSVRFYGEVPEKYKQRFRSTFFPDENNEAETNSTPEDVQ